MNSKILSGKNILLTGAGGPAISGMISLLREAGAYIVSVDMLHHSSGFYLSDKSYVVPPGDSPEFLSAITRICKDENISAVVSVVDEELPHILSLKSLGIAVVQPQLDFVKLALDKFNCMNHLSSVGLFAPKTFLASDYNHELSFPIFLKPRVGRGSRGAARINNIDEYKLYMQSTDYDLSSIIVQPFIFGTEYTVSVVVGPDGYVHSVVPKKIIKKLGVTKLAVTEIVPSITSLCHSIQNKLHANGPFNVQLILDDQGIPYPFEINPRFSTSTTLTASSGVNELVGAISLFLDPDSSFSFPQFTPGVVMIRQTVDTFCSLDEYHATNIVCD